MTSKDFRTFVNCVDIAVHDLGAAATTMELLLGLKPSPLETWEDQTDGSKLTGFRFQTGGLQSLRFVQADESSDGALSRFVKQRGEGIYSIDLQVAELDRRVDMMRDAGINFSSDRAVALPSGQRMMSTVADSTDGCRFVLNQPAVGIPDDADVYVGPRTSPTTVQRAYVLDLAVSNLDDAVARYSLILGIDGVHMDPAMDPSDSMDGCHFPTGGLYNIGLLAPRHTPKGPIPQAAKEYITKYGDGAFLLGFHVDISAKQAELRAAGVPLVFESPIEYKIGRMSMTAPLFGVSWFYGQWVEGGYEIWREELDV